MQEHTHISSPEHITPAHSVNDTDFSINHDTAPLPELGHIDEAAEEKLQSIAATAIDGCQEVPEPDALAATDIPLHSVLDIRRARRHVARLGKTTPESSKEEDGFIREIISHLRASETVDESENHRVEQSLHALRETCFEAIERLVKRRLAFWIQKYGTWDPDKRQEIESVVRVSMFNAVRRFDLSQQNTFVTFTARTVEGSVQHYFRDTLKQQSGLRRNDLELASAVKRELKSGKDLPTVARDLDVDEGDAREVISIVEGARTAASINDPKSAEQLQKSASTGPDPEEVVTRDYLGEELQGLLSRATLSLRDHHVLKYRFCIGKTAKGHFFGDPLQEPKTHKEIAAMLEWSESSVHKTEKKLIERFGRALGAIDA